MKYFTFKELSTTEKKIINEPNENEKDKLRALVDNALDVIREKYGKPIIVNSGFRSIQLNKAVGGVPTSQHCKGEAVDIISDDMEELQDLILDMIFKKEIIFDQFIIEYPNKEGIATWLHISYNKEKNRNQILIYNGKNYSTYKRNH